MSTDNFNTHKRIGEIGVNIIIQKGKQINKLIQNRIIRDIQRLDKNAMVLSDDSGLKNVWDEYCSQLQSDQSFTFGMLEDVVFNICSLQLEKLFNTVRADYDILRFYLEDNQYNDINDFYEENITEDLTQIMFNQIGSIASNYSNKRIDRFIYR